MKTQYHRGQAGFAAGRECTCAAMTMMRWRVTASSPNGITWACLDLYCTLRLVKYHNHDLRDWLAKHRPQWDLEVVSRPKGVQVFVRAS